MLEAIKTKLITLDYTKWVNNSLVFLAPLAILYLLNVQSLVAINGFQTSDFVLDDKMVGAFTLYVVNVLLDFFKKYKNAQ
mgnify:CR=1 FL=1